MKNRGFTLIELLIVIAIIAILALIAIPNFLEAQTRAKVSRAQADMRSLATAIEAFYTDNKVCPNAYSGVYILGGYVPAVDSPNTYDYQFSSGQWFLHQRNLTTPVQYITTVMADAFQEKDIDRKRASGINYVFDNESFVGGVPNQPATRRALAYCFEVNLESLLNKYNYTWGGWGVMAQNQAFHMDYWRKANGEATWMLLSAGPDRDVFTGYREKDPDAAHPAESTILTPWPLGNYDPSNGSISWGAIRRTNSPSRSN